MARGCNYTFTMNNYPDTTLVDTLDCKYIIHGKEVGESGTPHLQGTVIFPSQRTISSVIKKMPGCHVEICRSLHHAIQYCKKEGDFTERGEPPSTSKEKGEKEKDRWRDIRLAAEEGRFDDVPEEIRFKNIHLLQTHRDIGSKKRKIMDTEEQHLWYCGPSGTGKSRKAREDHPDAYLKMCNKWWDGNEDHETVLIEDLDSKHDVLGHHLKIWGDRYPFLAEYKGGAVKIRPKLIIVTSNYEPSEIWPQDSTLEPILRRFKVIKFPTNPFS